MGMYAVTVVPNERHGTADWQLDFDYETYTAEQLRKSMFSDDDFPASEIAAFISQADGFLGQAIEKLARATDMAEGWEKEKELDKILERLDELRVDLRAERRKLCGDR